MTVDELIDALERVPGDLPVRVQTSEATGVVVDVRELGKAGDLSGLSVFVWGPHVELVVDWR